MALPSFALNLSRKTRRMRAWPVSNASRYSYSLIISDFEYFMYIDGNRQAHLAEGLDALRFAREVHNVTLLKIFELYQLAYRCVAG
jgi:hypothetical protein